MDCFVACAPRNDVDAVSRQSAEFNDVRVRQILQRNGWFQTVISDLPHFTYLGISETELADRGLAKVISTDRPFWIPDLSTE